MGGEKLVKTESLRVSFRERISVKRWNAIMGSCVFGVHRLVSFDQNQLTGSISSTIGRWSMSLTVLYLSQNQFVGTVPAGIAALTGLVVLDVANNQLQGSLPPGMSALTSLALLSVSGNRLSGGLPTLLSLLSRLTYLDLGNNLFSSTVPTWLLALTGITTYVAESVLFLVVNVRQR